MELLQEKLDTLFQRNLDVQAIAKLELIHHAWLVHRHGLSCFDEKLFSTLPVSLDKENLQPIWHIIEDALLKNRTDVVRRTLNQLSRHRFTLDQSIQLDCYQIWTLLLEKNLDTSAKELSHYPKKLYDRKANSINFLYGCWIGAKKGKNKALNHFALIPKQNRTESWRILIESLEKPQLKNKTKLHTWEKRRLYRRLSLFYHCIKDPN